jgi:hypothetical protein
MVAFGIWRGIWLAILEGVDMAHMFGYVALTALLVLVFIDAAEPRLHVSSMEKFTILDSAFSHELPHPLRAPVSVVGGGVGPRTTPMTQDHCPIVADIPIRVETPQTAPTTSSAALLITQHQRRVVCKPF